jgi:predicted  nucleic acid-binding Zn-ribbon protein
MIEIIETVAGLFVFSLLVAPIVMLTILLLRTRKPKNPNQSVKLEQLEQNDYNIVDDVNKAFHDVSQSIAELQEKMEEIEQKMDREESTIKGFSDKRQK